MNRYVFNRVEISNITYELLAHSEQEAKELIDKNLGGYIIDFEILGKEEFKLIDVSSIPKIEYPQIIRN